MIKKLEVINDNVLNIIIYSSSPTLDLMGRDILKKKFTKDKECVIDVNTVKELNTAKLDSNVSPLSGGKWLIHANVDKFSRKDLIKAINNNSSYGVTVYWTSKYKIYKDLTSLEVVKKMGVYCASYYLGRLSFADIMWVHDKQLGEGNKYLSQDLKVYVAKNYAYDIEGIFELFRLLKSGYEVESKKDIINLIGVGNNSVEVIALALLRSSATTDKGKLMLSRKVLKLINDLNSEYDYRSIRNFMLNFLDGCLELKQLQIMGYYIGHNKIIPENFNEKRIMRLKRFEYTILNEISVPRILNLKLALKKYNNFDYRISLTQGILEYIGTLGE